MKKFLSILLALAVGFTFTFGSAMSAFAVAGETYTYEQAYKLLDDTAKDLKADAETDLNTSVKNYGSPATTITLTVADLSGLYTTSTDKTITISKDAAKELFKDIYDDYCKLIDTK